jgi:hypothetical protein
MNRVNTGNRNSRVPQALIPQLHKISQISFLWMLLFLLPSCTSTQVIDANASPALHSQEEVPEHLLLDIGIAVLDPGIPDTEEAIDKRGIDPDVRRAESRFIAYHLKDTLELTGNWGAVRVVPQDSTVVDIKIDGRILVSDGEMLKAKIKATDSTGKVWLNKEYSDTASKLTYRNRLKEDPFQDLYNDFANDLLAARRKLSDEDLLTLRNVSAIKFAKSLSPYAFDDYIEESRGGKKIVIAQLPADDDPMFARINQVKEREYMFIDTLDDYYANFYREMEASYHDWRQYSYEEAILLREMTAEARKRALTAAALIVGGVVAGSNSNSSAGQTAALAGVLGGVGLAKSALEKYKESEIHKESLKEISQSLGSEIRPIVLDIEGRTVELTGTLNSQYEQWRRILKEIYSEETGLAIE